MIREMKDREEAEQEALLAIDPKALWPREEDVADRKVQP